MDVSDILVLIEILVTILVGYYITHWVSIRDTRTRMVKDFYISELKIIKKEVDSFFSDLFNSKLNGRKIADWYGHQQQALTCFDEGLRMALPIKKIKLEDVVNSIHETITGSEYFNDHFKDRKYQMNCEEKSKVIELQERTNQAFNEYLVQINNSRQFYSWELILQNFKYDLEYFHSIKHKSPKFIAVGIRFLKIIPHIAVFCLVILGGRKIYALYNEKQEEDRKEYMRTIKLQETLIEEITKQNAAFEDVRESLRDISESKKETEVVVKIANTCCTQN